MDIVSAEIAASVEFAIADTWGSFLLIRNPDVLCRLRQEIQDIFKSEEELTRTHVQRMTYLGWVLNESK